MIQPKANLEPMCRRKLKELTPRVEIESGGITLRLFTQFGLKLIYVYGEEKLSDSLSMSLYKRYKKVTRNQPATFNKNKL